MTISLPVIKPDFDMLLFPVAGDRSGQLVLPAATTVPFVSYSPFFCLTATPGSLCFQLATVLVQRKERNITGPSNDGKYLFQSISSSTEVHWNFQNFKCMDKEGLCWVLTRNKYRSLKTVALRLRPKDNHWYCPLVCNPLIFLSLSQLIVSFLSIFIWI